MRQALALQGFGWKACYLRRKPRHGSSHSRNTKNGSKCFWLVRPAMLCAKGTASQAAIICGSQQEGSPRDAAPTIAPLPGTVGEGLVRQPEAFPPPDAHGQINGLQGRRLQPMHFRTSVCARDGSLPSSKLHHNLRCGCSAKALLLASLFL